MNRIKTMLQRLNEDEGAELLEFIGVMPLILLAAVFVWQFLLLGYTTYTVASAAREGARALAVGADCPLAAENASFNWDDSQRRVSCQVTGRTATVTVELQVFRTEFPLLGFLPDYPYFSSTAVSRLEPRPN